MDRSFEGEVHIVAPAAPAPVDRSTASASGGRVLALACATEFGPSFRVSLHLAREIETQVARLLADPATRVLLVASPDRAPPARARLGSLATLLRRAHEIRPDVVLGAVTDAHAGDAAAQREQGRALLERTGADLALTTDDRTTMYTVCSRDPDACAVTMERSVALGELATRAHAAVSNGRAERAARAG